ncbi:GNAT family N-acetyltransferase [Micromonospora costi]|uniref:GNAT family N-acetyltransferase n=1 Tax=Micromonospora costi TaxID=1530042 RepID=UPI0033F1BB31
MTEASGPIDVGRALRALRRRADLSQRELAERSGVPKSTLARIESGRGAEPRFATVERLVRAAGGEVAIAVSGGTRPREASGVPGDGLGSDFGRGSDFELSPDDELRDDELRDDELRDDAGRRYPSHLDVRKVRRLTDWPGAWWAHWYTLPPERWPLRVPEVTYDLDRRRRDERRWRERIRRQVRVRRDTAGLPDGSLRLLAELPDGALIGELRAHERSVDLFLGEDLGDEREIVVDGVLVAPEVRLLGIGRRLVALLADEMARAGIRTARATAEFGGVSFLMACGFALEASRPTALRLDRRQRPGWATERPG